ncbi:MAG: tellurite resistance TerB family protein [Thermodesulfobacteriota bacterium]
MAGFMDILGTVMQQGMAQSSGSRMSSAMGGGKSGGSLEDIMGSLGKMLGGAQAGQTSQPQGAGGLGGALGDVLGSLGGNKAALGGLGALAGALFGGGKGAARGAVGGGSLAMLATLAFSALKKAGQAPANVPRALLEPQTPQEQEALEQDAEVIVKAMINAAKADGKIDETEVEKIVGKLEKDGLTREEKEFFVREANKPMDLDGVVSSAAGQPDMAAQIYAASLLAIEVDTQAEQRYMQELAAGFGLHPQVTASIENALGVRAA